jgi:predicted transcriptional regulator
MFKISYNPNAYLAQRRNVRLGLVARTKILQVIEKQASSIKDIRQASGLKYAVILYHLKLLKKEKIVQRKGGKKPFFWALTGAGQKRLIGN